MDKVSSVSKSPKSPRVQQNFFKKVEGGTEHVGQILEMEKFVKF